MRLESFYDWVTDSGDAEMEAPTVMRRSPGDAVAEEKVALDRWRTLVRLLGSDAHAPLVEAAIQGAGGTLHRDRADGRTKYRLTAPAHLVSAVEAAMEGLDQQTTYKAVYIKGAGALTWGALRRVVTHWRGVRTASGVPLYLMLRPGSTRQVKFPADCHVCVVAGAEDAAQLEAAYAELQECRTSLRVKTVPLPDGTSAAAVAEQLRLRGAEIRDEFRLAGLPVVTPKDEVRLFGAEDRLAGAVHRVTELLAALGRPGGSFTTDEA